MDNMTAITIDTAAYQEEVLGNPERAYKEGGVDGVYAYYDGRGEGMRLPDEFFKSIHRRPPAKGFPIELYTSPVSEFEKKLSGRTLDDSFMLSHLRRMRSLAVQVLMQTERTLRGARLE